jgi:hypothetical protein
MMKTKKALKRLTRVEALLSEILKEYSRGEKLVRESLDAAKALVVRALESISPPKNPVAGKKSATRSKKSAVAAKKQIVPAKQTGRRSAAAPIAKKRAMKAAAARKPKRVMAKRPPSPKPSPATPVTEPVGSAVAGEAASMTATTEF